MRDAGLTERAKAARKAPTPAEQTLWFALRAERFAGVKFHRQKVIGPYIADFASNVPKVVVELDGNLHGETAVYDAERTAYLTHAGYRVVRFTNADVIHNLNGVLRILEDVVHDPLSQPSPPRGRGL
ncbi:endonuclease domain-containing protein [uncultured Sphingomonas sp.]|uniref:endonuclease domain-containing protein n=1 Tax=uncultured Sphingomonas sp. TaxID=158754 RepID=UPI0025D25342|nr:endonuclease domain-containing protein [uncultured Sphingomonas sp.]